MVCSLKRLCAPSPPLRFSFSRAPYSSSQLPIAAHTYTYVRIIYVCTWTSQIPLHVPRARAIQTRVSFPMPMAGKNESNKCKIIQNEVRFGDDTVPKTVGITLQGRVAG